ncbi:hypothetical protein FS837_007561 [Tulasnella sp. UAMH 9824]|nr:hypothetical protein FS837_007561 [Tulasnella sp. UAMH 9824]
MLPSSNPSNNLFSVPDGANFNAAAAQLRMQQPYTHALGSAALTGVPDATVLNAASAGPIALLQGTAEAQNLSLIGGGAGGLGVPGSFALPFAQPSADPVQSFMASLEKVATQDIPQIEAFARNALDGITRAFEQHAEPAQTAANLQALRAALGALYEELKATGLGALPLNPDATDAETLLNPAQPDNDPKLKVLTEQVNAIFKEGKNARDRATVVIDVLKTQAGPAAGAAAGAGTGAGGRPF